MRHQILTKTAALLAWFCLLFLTAGPSWADSTDAILIYGPQTAGQEELDQARKLLETSLGEGQLPNSSVHILDLPFPSPDPVWMAGDARVVPCTDPELENQDLAGLLSEAVDQIDALDYEAGKRILDSAIAALPCSAQPVDRTVLINLFYFRGIAAFHMGDRTGAQQSFSYALSIEKEKTWDTNYPPEPQQVFLLAKEDSIGLARVNVGYDVRGSNVDEFNFDGAAHDPGQAGVLQVIPGMHLVQYKADGHAYSRLLEVRADGPAALVTRLGLTTAVEGGPSTSGMMPAARASLRALVQGRNLERAFVVITDKNTGQIYKYDESYTTISKAAVAVVATTEPDTSVTTDPTPDLKTPIARTNDADLDTGGGLTLGFIGVGLAHDTSYLRFQLRGHIRLVAGLEVDLGGGMGARSYRDGDDNQWTSLLPYVRAGARYRFGKKKFRPYVGAALVINFWASEERTSPEETVQVTNISPGGALMGGFDVHLSKMVVLNLDLDFGYAYRIWGGATLGFGLRF